MQTVKQWGIAENRRDSYAVALGKLFAVGIILAPLAMMLFSELNPSLGNTSHGRQEAPTVREPAPARVLILDPYDRCGK
jgi:hypothetical protein